jgi:hypothetical protein
MLDGPVFADLSEAPEALRPILHRIQPLTSATFARAGVDLFTQRFPVKLFGEGTIRGTGGLRIADEACRTTTPASSRRAMRPRANWSRAHPAAAARSIRHGRSPLAASPGSRRA